MATDCPEWADVQLSDDLIALCSRGENQDLEYMAKFPDNARELGREIAAFATSNPGTILIGIADSGELVGLDGIETTETRDDLIRRIEGVCKGTVRPAITPVVKFAHREGNTVAVIVVPKGSQPVYYYQHVPYVRHVTQSRPAEPHEVVELVGGWLVTSRAPEQQQESPISRLLSELAPRLFDVLVYGEEYTEREVNPHFEEWRSQYKYCATQLRQLSLQDAATENNLAVEIINLAELLDDITSFRMTLGSGPDLSEFVRRAVALAYDIKRRHIDSAPLSDSAQGDARRALAQHTRRLRALVKRWDQMSDRNQEDAFQAEASAIGGAILRLSYYNLDPILPGLSSTLRDVGRRLHLLETVDTGSSDGGRALRTILDTTAQCADALERIEL